MLLSLPSVRFDVIAPAGHRLLAALDSVGRIYSPITITSACDGEHSGEGDPHHRGEAYDVRSHDYDAATKHAIFIDVLITLEDGEPVAKDDGWVTEHFFGWLEQAGTVDEHFHFQLRHGATLTV